MGKLNLFQSKAKLLRFHTENFYELKMDPLNEPKMYFIHTTPTKRAEQSKILNAECKKDFKTKL